MNSSTLPRERMHIVCKTAQDETETELPLRMLFVGDYLGRDDRALEDRVPIGLDRDTFAKVLAAHAPRLDIVVTSAAASEEESALRVSLTFRRLSDFGPGGVAGQIPQTNRLLAVRDALTALKTTGDVETFRRRIEELLVDAPARARLLASLGLGAP
jgi:type VI secretion system protein ImpB